MTDEPNMPLLVRIAMQLRERYRKFAATRADNFNKLDFPALETLRATLAQCDERTDQAIALVIQCMLVAEQVRGQIAEDEKRWREFNLKVLDMQIDQNTATRQ
jgi:hypothetical protein